MQLIHAAFVTGNDFVRLGSLWRNIVVQRFALHIANFQFVGFDESRFVCAIPISDGLIMFSGFVFAAMFEPDERVLSERHKIGEQKSIRRFNFVLIIFGFLKIFRAARMSGKWQRHVAATPIIAATAPFFRAGSVSLWRLLG